MTNDELDKLVNEFWDIQECSFLDADRYMHEAFELGRQSVLSKIPSDDQVRDYFHWSKDVKVTTPLQAFEVLDWLKSKLIGNEGK